MKHTEFGKNLYLARKKANLTQEQLASKLSISPQAVSKWERGSYPDGALLCEIADVLHVSLDYLFGRSNSLSEKEFESSFMHSLDGLSEQELGSKIFEYCYAMLCAFNDSSQYRHLSHEWNRETFAELRSDSHLALSRLNADFQFFCFFQIPKEGINSYANDLISLQRFFTVLSDMNCLKLIYLFASTRRNLMLTKEMIYSRMNISMDQLCASIDKLIKLGIIWNVTVEQTGGSESAYGYSHHSALAMIVSLASAYMRYIQVREPFIDTMTKGSFREKASSEGATNNKD